MGDRALIVGVYICVCIALRTFTRCYNLHDYRLHRALEEIELTFPKLSGHQGGLGWPHLNARLMHN